VYQDDLSFVDSQTGHVRLRIKRDGHLQIVDDLELFAGPTIEGGVKKYSVGLDSTGSAFVIRDEVNGTDLFRVDEYGPTLSLSLSSIFGLETVLDSKHPKLTVNGQQVASAVLDNFMLALDSDGVGYEHSLVTAKALRDWFELNLQPSLVMVQPGQNGPSFRVSSISSTSPSAINVPSCTAVSSFVATKLAEYQPLITPTTHLGDMVATSVRSTTTGYYQNGQTTSTTNIPQRSTTAGSDQVLLYNGSEDFDTLFPSGASVTISGITSPIGGIPSESINGNRIVQGFYTHPLDNHEPGFVVTADGFATSTANGTFNPHAPVVYSSQSFIHSNSDLLVSDFFRSTKKRNVGS
jgi:hypothetical protein